MPMSSPVTDLSSVGLGHVKVLPFTLEKSAYHEADPEYANCPTFYFEGWASLAVPDADGEIIHPGFFDARLGEFLANPVMRWMHARGDVQGKWLQVTQVPDRGYRASAVAIDFGRDVDRARLNMLRTGAVASLSVGFDAAYTPEYGYFDETTKLWHWTQNGRLLEISPCDIPACPGASIQLAKSLGQARPSLVVPDLATPADDSASGSAKGGTPEAAKSDGHSVSLAANLAAEEAAEAARENLWEVLDGLWTSLWYTLEAILAFPGDRTALIEQLGAELAAEITARLNAVSTGATAEQASGLMLGRAIAELTALKAVGLELAQDADWPLVAATAARLFGAAGGLGVPERSRQAAVDALSAHYARLGKAFPEYAGAWPASLKDVTFRAGELDILEEQQGEEALRRLSGAAQRLADLSVHFAREGLTPSSLVLGTLAEAAQTAAEGARRVGKAGAVLSAANLALVEAAIAALEELRASAVRQTPDDAKSHDPDCSCCPPSPGAGHLDDALPLRVLRTSQPAEGGSTAPTLIIRR